MNKNDKIFIAGHNGLVGSSITRRLNSLGYKNLMLKSRQELDLTNNGAVQKILNKEKPVYVILAAAKVGGIKANMTYPAEFLYENLLIQNNVIWNSHLSGVKKLLFLGSSCIYPRNSKQPMKEDYLLEGKPEPTNEAYAVAKIAGMKLCEYIYSEFKKPFISCMPTNIYGPGDNFNPESSHVIPGLMQRMETAKKLGQDEVIIWGTGKSRREFMHCDDLADAIVNVMNKYSEKQFINIGTGEDITIKQLAYKVKSVVGYKGKLIFDATKPDGMPKKRLDVTKLNGLGWKPKTDFDKGLQDTYEWFIGNVQSN